MNTPLVSVVIPVFNVEEYLKKCLKSVENQTYENIEVVMVNDGSTDSSRSICKEFVNEDSRFKLFDKINGGLSDARNFGVSKSSGDFVTFVDSDDFIDNDYVKYLYDLLSKNNVKMSICQHRTVFTNGKVEHHFYHGNEKLSSVKTLERLLYSDEVDTSAWAKLYSKDLFWNIEFPVGKLFEDISTTYKFIMASEYVSIGSDEKYNYVYRSKSIVNKKFSLNKMDLISMTDQMGKDVSKKFPLLERAVLRRRVYAKISTLNQMQGVKEHRDIKNKLVKQIRLNGFKVLGDSKTPTRDKVALILIYLGYPVYSCFWKYYLKVKKGI